MISIVEIKKQGVKKMKKTLIALALLCVGTAVIAAPKVAKDAKVMKQWGKVSVEVVAGSVADATNDLEVLALKADGTDLTATIVKAGVAKYDKENKVYTDSSKNKTKLGNNVLPVGFDAKGSADKWAWADKTVNILGFKGKLVYLQLTDNATNDVRIYAYQLGTSKKDKDSGLYVNKKDAKVVGSTSNILAADFGKAVSDGKKVWILAANTLGRGTANEFLMEFDKKLNGLYNKADKSKLHNAKKEIVVDAATVDNEVLPTFKQQYSYTVDNVPGAKEIRMFK